VIVPTRNAFDYLHACIESLLNTDYPNFSITVCDNASNCKKTLDYLKKLEKSGIHIVRWPYPFNFSAINNLAVNRSTTELVCLVNNDIEAPNSDWLKEMVKQLLRENVGAVGAKLLWPNGMVQHSGIQLGLHGLAGHVGNNWLDTDTGYHDINQQTRSVSGVTAACLLVRRDDYISLGGLDEHAFPIAFNDVDFCLRLRESGKRIVISTDAKLIHAESATRGKDDIPPTRARLDREKSNLLYRWKEQLYADPYYNPNLNLDRYSHSGLAIPPRHL
jgi:GT2 family glycosyltransferase